jgi:hypothetical protein
MKMVKKIKATQSWMGLVTKGKEYTVKKRAYFYNGETVVDVVTDNGKVEGIPEVFFYLE